ncbi:hypothetical protein BDB01DRAFT_771488 [Pilobolus umbonatus]|nr:hypothetical protein BDB01DRAFT_771488 [Pilobolus umbonatus]
MSESINNSDITAMATSDAVNTTSDTPPPTTTAQEPTTTPAEPTSDPPVTPPEPTTTRKPSEPTTKPDTSKSPNQPTSAAETSKSTSKKATTIMTSTPVEVVTVYTSGNAVYTSTSTSFREYATVSEVSMEEGSSGSNSGAIAGGVVGGVAFIAFLGNYLYIVIAFDSTNSICAHTALAAFCIIKRKKNKRYDTDDMDENLSQPPMNAHPFNDYNAYGSAAMASNDSHSVLGHNRTMSQNTVPIQAVKPRPFVQAYNPGLEDSTMGSQYTGAYEQPQPNYPMNPQEEQYYHDYHQQPYQTQYMTNDYNNYQPDNNYYNSAASDIMTSAPSSHTGPITGNMNVRNVPDEVDYKPDEIPSHSAYRTN